MFGHIFVDPGFFLTLDSAIITGCNYMWRGIRVEHEADITLENGSKIADANRGIFMAEYSSYFIIHNSAIVNCIREIYVEPSSSNGYNVTTCEVYGSQFGKRNPNFKKDYPGQPNHGTLAITDFELHDMTGVVIGNDNQQPNQFLRANRGITVVGSNVTVTNSEFEGITLDTSYHWGYDGYAVVAREDSVYGRNSRLYVFPLANATNPPTIHDGFRGVYSRHSNLDVRGLYIKNVVSGIMSELSSNYNTVTLLNNHIEASRNGIRWRFNVGAATMLAQQNVIIMSGDTTGTAIAMVESTSGIANYHVLENTITLSDSRFGIRSNAVNEAEIKGNYIKMNRAASPVKKDGIVINGNVLTQVGCNIIEAYDIDDTGIRGIVTNISKGTEIVCNQVDSSGIGIFFGGVSNSTNFKGNSMNHHYVGLYENNVAVIDQQPPGGNPPWHGNTWLDSANYTSTYGAVNLNDSAQNSLIASLFTTDQNNQIYNPVIPVDTNNAPFYVTDQGWFAPDPLDSTFNCDTSQTCIIYQGAGGSDALRMMIAQGNAITSDFVPESKVVAQQYLYDELKSNQDLLQSNNVFENFVDAKEEESIGLLYEVKKLLTNINKIDSAERAYMTFSKILIFDFLDSIHRLDSTNFISSVVGYSNLRKSFVDQIGQLQQNQQFIFNQRKARDSSNVVAAKELNNIVTASGIPDANEKYINSAYIRFEQDGINGLIEEYANILAIALQCPFSGGPAVFKAWSLVGLLNDSIEFDYDLACLQEGIFKLSKSQREQIEDIVLEPNPATNFTTVILKGNYEGICDIKIYDVMGKLILNKTFNCIEKKKKISTNELAPGIYKVAVYINNNERKTAKLIIAR